RALFSRAMAIRLSRGSQARAMCTSAAGPTIPMRSSLGADLSAAPCFAMTRRGSTPVSLAPNNSLGSGRHSILMFRLIAQSDFWHFHGQKSHVNQQVVNVKVADVHRFASPAEEARP